MSTDGEALAAGYDPYLDEIVEDPYPHYAALREHCPVHYLERLDLFSLTRFDDVLDVLRRDEEYFSGEGVVGPRRLPDFLPEEFRILEQADGARHRQHRRMVDQAFRPRRMRALQPRLEEISHGLIDRFVEAGKVEIVAEYCTLFPAIVIAELFGVPREDHVDFKRWADEGISALGDDTDEGLLKAFPVIQEFGAYISEKVEVRRSLLQRGNEAPDDLVTVLAQGEIEGRPLSDMEVIGFAFQLLGAGHQSSVSMLTNLVYLLCTHPDEFAKVRGNPALVESAVEEVLRYEAPVQGLCRSVRDDADWHGVSVPSAARMRVIFGAANRDPKHWGGDAEQFRVDRATDDVRQHLSFGFGIHYCVGAPLARMEGQVALRHIVERLPDLRLDPDGEPVRNHWYFARVWDALPVSFSPGRKNGGDDRSKAAIIE